MCGKLELCGRRDSESAHGHVMLGEQRLLPGPGLLTVLPRGQRGLQKSRPDGFARTAILRETEAFLLWKITKPHESRRTVAPRMEPTFPERPTPSAAATRSLLPEPRLACLPLCPGLCGVTLLLGGFRVPRQSPDQ